MSINMIWAMDKNWGIGYKNKLPWNIPEDLAYFKKTTEGASLIMGSNTYESLPGVLKGRTHIILTDRDVAIKKNAHGENERYIEVMADKNSPPIGAKLVAFHDRDFYLHEENRGQHMDRITVYGGKIEDTLACALFLVNGKETFVCGGAFTYKLFLPHADKLFITWIDKEYTVDTYFPRFDISKWQLLKEKKHTEKELRFCVYTRKEA